MRVFICVCILGVLAAAEPPLFSIVRESFRENRALSNENNEGSKSEENDTPYSPAGFKPVKEFKLPKELFSPSTNQELPSRERFNTFENFSRLRTPHISYASPENERKTVSSENSVEQSYDTHRLNYIAPSIEQQLPSRRLTEEFNDNYNSEENNSEKGDSNTEVKERTENREDSEHLDNKETFERKETESNDSKNEINVNDRSEKSSSEERRKMSRKENSKERRQGEKKRFYENIGKEGIEIEDIDHDIIPPRPYFIIVSSPQAQPFQREIDIGNVGVSTYSQQKLVHNTPPSYFFQTKFQNPYFLPLDAYQWGNQW